MASPARLQGTAMQILSRQVNRHKETAKKRNLDLKEITSLKYSMEMVEAIRKVRQQTAKDAWEGVTRNAPQEVEAYVVEWISKNKEKAVKALELLK